MAIWRQWRQTGDDHPDPGGTIRMKTKKSNNLRQKVRDEPRSHGILDSGW